MTPFIVILVAVPVVFWLSRRGRHSGIAETQHDEGQEAIASASDDAPVQVEHAAVSEAALPMDRAPPDNPSELQTPPDNTAPEQAPPPELQRPCAPASSSIEDEVAAEPAPETGASSAIKDHIEAIEDSGTKSVSGQGKLERAASLLAPQTAQFPASHANGEGKEPAFSDMDASKPLPSTDAEEPAALPAVAARAAPNFEARLEENTKVEQETAVSLHDHYVAEANVSHDAENGEVPAASEPKTVISCPHTSSGHSEHSIRAVSEIASRADEDLLVGELIAINNGGRHEPSAGEIGASPVEAGDFISTTAANGESSLLQPTRIDDSLWSEEPPSRDVEPAKLEDLEVSHSSRYRPPPQRQARRSPSGAGSTARVQRSEIVLAIRVRLTMDRFGFCQISLLPERKPTSSSTIRNGPRGFLNVRYFAGRGSTLHRNSSIVSVSSVCVSHNRE